MNQTTNRVRKQRWSEMTEEVDTGEEEVEGKEVEGKEVEGEEVGEVGKRQNKGAGDRGGGGEKEGVTHANRYSVLSDA